MAQGGTNPYGSGQKGFFKYAPGKWGYVGGGKNSQKIKWDAKKPGGNKARQFSWGSVRKHAKKTGQLGGKPKRPMSGWFQYGHDQYGYYKNGKVGWDAKAPKSGQPVFSWNKIKGKLTPDQLSGMPTPKVDKTPPPWINPEYGLSEEQIRHDRDTTKSDIDEQRRLMIGDYEDTTAEIARSKTDNLMRLGGSTAGRGLYRSGSQATGEKDIADRAASSLRRTEREYGTGAQDYLNKQATEADTTYGERHKWLVEQAKELYRDTHQGEEPPKRAYETGVKKVGNKYTYTYPDGRTVSVSAQWGKKKLSAGKKPKPSGEKKAAYYQKADLSKMYKKYKALNDPAKKKAMQKRIAAVRKAKQKARKK